MIYDQIKKQAIDTVPFARHTGVQATDAGRGTSTALLREGPNVINHVGTLHAGALYTLGEAASGIAMAGAVAPLILAVRPVASEAQIRYLKPAKGTITATGKVRENVDELVQQLNAVGKVTLTVDVVMQDENGVVVAEMVVTWHVRMK
jgi:acyl-coenzyme A thioesterase PaaI-like protein